MARTREQVIDDLAAKMKEREKLLGVQLEADGQHRADIENARRTGDGWNFMRKLLQYNKANNSRAAEVARVDADLTALYEELDDLAEAAKKKLPG